VTVENVDIMNYWSRRAYQNEAHKPPKFLDCGHTTMNH